MPHTIKIKYDSIDVLKFILSFLIIRHCPEFCVNENRIQL